MATFIKAGFWEKLCQKCTGYKGWLNLDQFVKDNSSLPYKVYTAVIYQDGSASVPTVNVLQNTLGSTPTWVYSNTGAYKIDLQLGNLDATKTPCFITLDPNTSSFFGYLGLFNDTPPTNFVLLTTYDENGQILELGGYASIEIRVYP